jgi:uncharacterized membrane protein YjgN (DUF898 family)
MEGAAPDEYPLRYRFAFTGDAAAYFRIWIVSLCLSLLTLGVYSAWGKVRKRRYLQTHTRLDGDGLDYRASPLAILRGRVLAILFLGGFALATHFFPLAQLGFLLLVGVLSPWIVVAAARFNAHNTTYRNVAFAFDGRVREAAGVILGGALIVVVSLGLAYPWYRMRRARFVAANHRYGVTPFSTHLDTGEFYLTYLIALVMFGGVVAAGIGSSMLGAIAGKGAGVAPGVVAGVLLTIAVYAAYIAIYAYLRARTLNLIANGTTVGPVHLESTLRARTLAWIYISNVVAILLTLGLATPWATVRIARYRAQCLAARTDAPLATLSAGGSPGATATGSEVSDLFDVDVAL